MVDEDQVMFVQPGQGRFISVLGSEMTFKVTGDDTNGNWCLIEYSQTPGARTPPQHAHDWDEAYYILQGQMTFRIRDRTFDAAAGSFLLVPGGIPHTYTNGTSEAVDFLLMLSPAGFERFFEDVEVLLETEPSPSMDTVQDLAAKHGLETLERPWAER